MADKYTGKDAGKYAGNDARRNFHTVKPDDQKEEGRWPGDQQEAGRWPEDRRTSGRGTCDQYEDDESADIDEYRRKLRGHRFKVTLRTVIVIAVIVAIVCGLCVYMSLRHYEDYDIITSVERQDTDAAKFLDFQGNILKYSNDGAFYLDAQNELIWNQTYEMASPQVDICEGYLAIYDMTGTDIFIMNADGQLGSIEMTAPIEKVRVASQGTVAVLTRKDDVAYLDLYDKSGSALASGAIYGENGGYPIAIALSQDAIKLAVSLLDISDGTINSTIAFYNFGSVGQNMADNCVGVNTFSDTIVPEMAFLSSNRMIALSDSGIMFFEGTQTPQLAGEIDFDKEVKSIFYNESCIGIVTDADSEDAAYHLDVYDASGKVSLEMDFDTAYENIAFLSGNEICIMGGNVCDIYTKRGTYKFHYDFGAPLYRVISGAAGLNYTFVLKGETQSVRLK